MRAILRLIVLSLLLLIAIRSAEGFIWRNKDKKDDSKEKKITGKDSAALGMMGLADLVREGGAEQFLGLKEAMRDPEIMREVEELMRDPEFKLEMDKVTGDPMFSKAMHHAKDVLGTETASDLYKTLSEEKKKKSDFELGMEEMAKAAKNPKILAEALEMLKDPAIAAEVEAMMKDPKFSADMKKLTDSPGFKESMATAAEALKEIDPSKVRQR